MKIIYLLIIGIFLTQLSFGQSISISPVITNEFCSNVETTFTVTIPGPFVSISPASGSSITVYPTTPTGTTFTFKGKFGDYNQTQIFRVVYYNGSTNVPYDFNFKKIKSLFHTVKDARITLSTSNITANRCQIQNFNVSFTNVKYGNPFVSPAISYGSITNYQYQLPSGWSIGSTTSTGSNWIAGGNNVTVTSDLGTGDGGSIKIRASNVACGTGLYPGPVKEIFISRPAPTLAIPETQTDICSGSVNYTLTGLPAGATTTWSITNNNSVSSISNATNNSVTVNKISANRGVEILKATVTHCSYTYVITKTLNFGAPVSSFQIQNYLPLEVSCYETQAFYIFKPSLILGNYTASYQWSYRVNGTTSETIVPSSSEDGVFIFDFPGTYDILVRSVNSCGLGEPSMITITVVYFCYSFRMSVYPNPASGEINVSIDEESEELKKIPKTEKLKYQLVDIKNSSIVKSWTLDNTSTKQKLDVTDIKPDQYIIIVTKGKYKKAMKVIIN